MDGQRALAPPALDGVPTIPTVEPSASRPTSAAPPADPTLKLLKVAWAAALGVGWPLASVAILALEPEPANPEAPVPVIIELARLGLLAALLATTIAAGVRHPAAAIAGVVSGIIAMTFTVTCPVSGHHSFGLWWFGELGLVTAMLVVSLIALGRRATTTT
jgi:hypothetical protein